MAMMMSLLATFIVLLPYVVASQSMSYSSQSYRPHVRCSPPIVCFMNGMPRKQVESKLLIYADPESRQCSQKISVLLKLPERY